MDEQFKDTTLKQKYFKPYKTTFHQLSVLIGDLQKLKFPKCYFTDKVFQVYDEANKVESQIQEYFKRNAECL